MLVDMRIFTEKALKEYAEANPSAKSALQVWSKIVKKSELRNFSDVKKTFNSVDSIGEQRYVFNLKENEYRLVAVIKFTIGYVYIRFFGTHKEYEKVNCKEV